MPTRYILKRHIKLAYPSSHFVSFIYLYTTVKFQNPGIDYWLVIQWNLDFVKSRFYWQSRFYRPFADDQLLNKIDILLYSLDIEFEGK